VATPSKSCFVVPRVLIGPEESSPKDVFKQAVDGLDPFNFQTLRYRKFKSKIALYTGKSLVDARLFRGKGVISNPHKIHDCFCLGKDYPDFSSSLLKVHHYTGSFETYASRKGSSSESVKMVSSLCVAILGNTNGWLTPPRHTTRGGKIGQFGHLLGQMMMSKVGSNLLSTTLD
jgi:hypothetical protein